MGAIMASLLRPVTSHLVGCAGLPPCLSSCTSSTSSSLALQLPPPPSLTQKSQEDWHSTSDDCHQLVHVSSCVFVPNAWLFSGEGNRRNPDGLLRLRHHLEVRSWPRHLPDFLRQIQQAVSLAMSICMR